VTPADLLSGLAGPVAFGAAGWAITGLVPGLRLRAGHRLGFAYLLGVAWTAGVLYALSHFAGVPLRRTAVLAVVAVPLLAWTVRGVRAWRGRRRLLPGGPVGARELGRGRGRQRDFLALVVVLVAGAISLAVLAESMTAPLLDWDGRMTWASQARWVRAAGTVDAPVLQEKRWAVIHPRYPLLMPVAQVAALELTRAPVESEAFRPLYALFFPALLLVLWGEARLRAGRRAALIAVLALALAPFPAWNAQGGAAGAFSDLPLAAFWGAGVALLLRPRPSSARHGRSHGVAAGLLLAAAVLTKNEGWVLAPAAVVLAMLATLAATAWRGGSRRRRLTPAGLAALGVGLALTLLLSWRAGVPNRFDEAYVERSAWRNLGPAAWGDLLEVAPLLLRHTFGLESWGLLFWAALLVLVAGARGLRRRGGLPLLLAALGPLALGLAAYASNPHRVRLAEVTWSRFLLQAALPGMIALAVALRSLLPPGRPRPPG
jgi:hypothetical protein